MSFVFSRVVIVMLTLGIAARTAGAQGAEAANPFIGTWVMDVAASDFGTSPAPDSVVTAITRADDRLELSRMVWGTMGRAHPVTVDMPIDGTVHRMSPDLSDESDTGKAEWSGDTLMLTVFGESNVGQLEIVDAITVDGDTMRVERTIILPGVPFFTQSRVYRRRSG
jgi:hypothetical protein